MRFAPAHIVDLMLKLLSLHKSLSLNNQVYLQSDGIWFLLLLLSSRGVSRRPQPHCFFFCFLRGALGRLFGMT